jgi:branched-chain amino acid transport system ATP-binding protein
MSLTPPKTGTIKLKGVDITRKQPYEIARLGIGYAPDDRRIFPDLTIEENLLIAGRFARKTNRSWNVERIYQLFPNLGEKKGREGQALSGGEQKMLALGRGLMVNPNLLLLDEPSEGLAPLVVRALAEAILKIREAGVAILLADQNIRFCRRVSDRGYILDRGIIRYVDDMEKIWQNEEVIRKYLAV